MTCKRHEREWQAFNQKNNRQTQPGFRRALRRSDNDWPWLPQALRGNQPHDEPAPETEPLKNYFTAPSFYCTETICAPCGVVIAWTLFPKSESPTKILRFLETTFPTEESRPDYVCIDKGCLVLRTAIANDSWDRIWKDTTRFIVDSYHYINHKATDTLCEKWCNPAPSDGSAPNLVVVDTTASGQRYYKRAFNTQACEQLNAWLGGFESILRRMTKENYQWFLHTMLFYHTTKVIKRQHSHET